MRWISSRMAFCALPEPCAGRNTTRANNGDDTDRARSNRTKRMDIFESTYVQSRGVFKQRSLQHRQTQLILARSSYFLIGKSTMGILAAGAAAAAASNSVTRIAVARCKMSVKISDGRWDIDGVDMLSESSAVGLCRGNQTGDTDVTCVTLQQG